MVINRVIDKSDFENLRLYICINKVDIAIKEKNQTHFDKAIKEHLEIMKTGPIESKLIADVYKLYLPLIAEDEDDA